MLKSTRRKTSPHSGGRFAIVCSQYNPEYTQPMCQAAEAVLSAAGARFEVVSVPGAFEIPVAAAALLARGRRQAVRSALVSVYNARRRPSGPLRA
jgi:6,7-dimethyl-8-ribityllumazine synthase